MKKWILAGAASVFMTGAAMATDAPMMAPDVTYDWTGAYIAAFAGGAWGDVDVDDVNGYNGAVAGDFDYDADGFFGGVLAGYNWQNNRLVFGIEGALGYLGLDDSAQFPPYVGVRLPGDSRSSIDTDFFASLTGHAGIAAGNLLFYVKGGVAGLDTDVSFIDTDPTGTTLVSGTSASDFMVGWTAGGGLRFGLANGWIVGGEYMYADLGDINVRATDSIGGIFNFNHDVVVHTAKVVIGKRY
jgi:outer membrane immunogenic protein